jgi:hypothetical protein
MPKWSDSGKKMLIPITIKVLDDSDKDNIKYVSKTIYRYIQYKGHYTYKSNYRYRKMINYDSD